MGFRVLMRGGIYLIFIVGIIAQRVWKHIADNEKQEKIKKPKRITAEVTEQNVFDYVEDSSWRMRLAAMRVLQNYPSDEAYEALLGALEDDDYDVREVAAEALIAYQEDAVPDMLGILNNGSRIAREMAVKVLVSIGGDKALDGISDVLKHDESAWVRIAVIEALGKTQNPEYISLIMEALHDDHTAVYTSAVDALKQIGTDEALQAIAANQSKAHD